MATKYPKDGKPTPFAKRLRKAIEDSGYTYEILEVDSGISAKSILSYVNHNVEPRVGKLRALCEALGVSADYLIWGEEPYAGDRRE